MIEKEKGITLTNPGEKADIERRITPESIENIKNNKIDPKFLASKENLEKFWGEAIAEKVIETFPNERIYTCAAGISPSGRVHFGNFRDVMTSLAVADELKNMGKEVRFIFSWDDFDRFRKVPEGVSPDFSKYIGLPLSRVPDPQGEFESYARRFESEFELSVEQLGIDLEYIYQSREYASGAYDKEILECLKRRKEIADILLYFMSGIGKERRGIDPEKFREDYFPINVYSRFTGKDNTRVINYDGESKITYFCEDTQKEDEVDLTTDRIAKLGWKVDWAMRWRRENINFEPGGKDHSSPGGSYDTSSAISRLILNSSEPVFAGYDFIGIRGVKGKMSGSKGGVMTPADLLKVYEPDLLKWLYMRRNFSQTFNLSFDSEIIRQYDEYDRERALLLKGGLEGSRTRAIELSLAEDKLKEENPPISFRKILGYSQIVQWDLEKLKEILNQEGQEFDESWLEERMGKARTWLEEYNQGEKLSLLEQFNSDFFNSISEEDRQLLDELAEFLHGNPSASIDELENAVYSIPKKPDLELDELKKRQKKFFQNVYNLLLGKNQGPRLSTFLWAADRNEILKLLSQKSF